MEETKMTQETPAVPAKKLTKKDITKSMWIYYAGAELSNSYERPSEPCLLCIHDPGSEETV